MTAAVLVSDQIESPPDFWHARKPEELLARLNEIPMPVVIVPRKQPWLTESFLMSCMLRFPSPWLIGLDGFSSEELRRFMNTGRVHALLEPNQDYIALIKAFPQPSSSQQHLKALTQAMIGIQRASSIGEIEIVLNDALNLSLQLSWVRIVFENQRAGIFIEKATALSSEVASYDFTLRQSGLAGKILFGRNDKIKFKASEKKFLQEITDTTALALERLGKLDEAETLKQQWEATFDAISNPLCLTTEDFSIRRTNRAFSRVSGLSFQELPGRNAFEAFFPEQSFHPEGSAAFRKRLSKGNGLQKKDYEILGQPLGFELDGQTSWLLIFHDITEQLRLERRILESSKFAELGTIASSIAHELNNPLGGMLSFLQLIQMDLPKDSPPSPDIAAMVDATLKCRDIITNLLGFARARHAQDLQPVDLREALEQAVKLTELQSRSQAIELTFHHENQPLIVSGQLNALCQAFCNILQNSIDAIVERRRESRDLIGRIEIDLNQDGDLFRIQIRDNGLGIRPEHESQVFTPLFTTKASETNSGLGLTVAYSIFRDHGGDLEILSQTGSSTTAIITLPRIPDQS